MLKILFLFSLIAATYQANISICRELKSIFDSEGNYLLKICEVQKMYPHDRAESICRQYGMELLEIDSVVVFTAVAGYMGLARFETAKINGRRNHNGEWHKYTSFSRRKLATENFPWMINSTYGGNCLTLMRVGGFPKLSGHDCNKQNFFLCELERVRF